MLLVEAGVIMGGGAAGRRCWSTISVPTAPQLEQVGWLYRPANIFISYFYFMKLGVGYDSGPCVQDSDVVRAVLHDGRRAALVRP